MFFDRLFNVLGEEDAMELVTLVFLMLEKDGVIDLMHLFESGVSDFVKTDSEHVRMSRDTVLAIAAIHDLSKLEKKFKKCAGDIYQ